MKIKEIKVFQDSWVVKDEIFHKDTWQIEFGYNQDITFKNGQNQKTFWFEPTIERIYPWKIQFSNGVIKYVKEYRMINSFCVTTEFIRCTES